MKTLDELLTLLPEPITEYAHFTWQYQGLQDWVLYARLRVPTRQVVYRLILRTDEGPRSGSENYEYKEYSHMLNQHLALMTRLLA